MEAPSISNKTLTVGGRQVFITRCSAIEALNLELTLARTVGGGIAMATESADGAVAAVGAIAKQLSLEELTRLMNMVFQYVMIDNQKIIDINSAFADRPRDVWEVFVACIEHNLGPLGAWLREKFQQLNQTRGSKG